MSLKKLIVFTKDRFACKRISGLALVLGLAAGTPVLLYADTNNNNSVVDNVVGWAKSVMDTSSPEAKKILAEWILPETPPTPNDKPLDTKKVALGKMLFFDPRLSGNGKISCATCHNPALGWSDGLPTARGFDGQQLKRATPTIINVAYNSILMWDGREKSLESQAIAPIVNPEEMHNTVDNLVKTIKSIPGYVEAFNTAFYGLGVNETRIRTALASFQRTVVANNSPFDRWIDGDAKAMTAAQIRGFEIFTNPGKGNCAVCHRPPNFTDNGFHNIGLASFGNKNPDLGRHSQVPVDMTRGAFKTPPLRNIAQSAPYFHDGSAATLMEVVEHYARGGVDDSNLSPNLITPKLSQREKLDLVAFMEALTGELDPRLAQVELPR